jgi:hypothetical protein
MQNRIHSAFFILPSASPRYPCFCLCFTFVQMTRTTPLRRTILQFSQIRRTLALTFITTPSSCSRPFSKGRIRDNSPIRRETQCLAQLLTASPPQSPGTPNAGDKLVMASIPIVFLRRALQSSQLALSPMLMRKLVVASFCIFNVRSKNRVESS